jgi:nicotinate-nucleotide pyrophosphorylase (carboxylating)
MNIPPIGTRAVNALIDLALAEDIGPGDITTDNLVAPDLRGLGVVTAKEPLVLAGLEIARQVFMRLDPAVRFIPAAVDGEWIGDGKRVLEVEGSLRALLIGERTALNFLQRLSGISSCVRGYTDALGAGSRHVRLVDTRKTAPGWRVLEKYAVRVGGAHNHRTGLYDGVLIKDNHIAAVGGIAGAVERIRKAVSHFVRVEVEAADLAQVSEALAAGADIIMLDNMDLNQIREAVVLIDGRAVVEASGGVTLESLVDLAATGVDLISVGALTHSAKSVDLSMRIEPI